MGFNSTLIILNSGLDGIANDPEFGQKVKDAISAFSTRTSKRIDISSGGHCNCASVIAQEDADVHSIIAVGGNYGSVLDRTWRGNKGHHEEKDQVELLVNLAAQLGYEIRKTEKIS